MSTKFHCDACNAIHGNKAVAPPGFPETASLPQTVTVYRGVKMVTKQMDLCNICITWIEDTLGIAILEKLVLKASTPTNSDYVPTASDFI